MGALDVALDTLFASELAIDATYSAVGGPVVPVRAILLAADIQSDLAGSVKLQQQTAIFEVRKSELSSPEAKATISVGAANYRVTGVSTKDPRRAVWQLEAAPQ